MLRELLVVAGGGAAGAVARYLVSAAVQSRTGPGFPWGTLVVNLSGAFLLGLLAEAATRMPALTPEMRLLLATGFLGAFTTFSTLSLESLALLRSGAFGAFAANTLGGLALGLAACWLGMLAARAL